MMMMMMMMTLIIAAAAAAAAVFMQTELKLYSFITNYNDLEHSAA